MKKITLSTKTETINTTCEGISQHTWNEATVHRLSKRGKLWLSERKEDELITIITKDGSYKLTEITELPLP